MSGPRAPGAILIFGLPAAGKTSLGNALATVAERSGMTVVQIDGDTVRKNQSADLRFSKHDRLEQAERLGAMARSAAQDGKLAICSAIIPYEEGRRRFLDQFGDSQFPTLLVFVATPLAVCEQRDPKGLYAAARRGEIQNFTGVSDPFEEPRVVPADVTVDSSTVFLEDCAERVWRRYSGVGPRMMEPI